MLKSLAGRLAVVFALLVGGLALVGGSGVSAQTVADIEVRDRLIADQEALLNVYRCMFGVDVKVVPGGCSNGAPTLPAKDPAPFSGNPTPSDITVRDELVAAQEVLLNTYRCRFRIDMQQVPGGCPEPANQSAQETVTEPQETEVDFVQCMEYTYEWCLLNDGSWRAIASYKSSASPSDGVTVCGKREVLSDDHSECIPVTDLRHYTPEELAIFPRNCPPPFRYITGPNVVDPKSTLLSSRGLCVSHLTRWWYDPWDYIWTIETDRIKGVCNRRDFDLNRLEEVCFPPGTDANTLEPWQYVAAPYRVNTWEYEDRTNDPQVQKPYLYHDLPVMEQFCSQYPVVHRSCTYFFDE